MTGFFANREPRADRIPIVVTGAELAHLFMKRATEYDDAARIIAETLAEQDKLADQLRVGRDTRREVALELGVSNARTIAGNLGNRYDGKAFPEELTRRATYLRFCAEHLDKDAKMTLEMEALDFLFGVGA